MTTDQRVTDTAERIVETALCWAVYVDRFGQRFSCTRRVFHIGQHWCTGRPWHRNSGSRTYWAAEAVRDAR